jgi:hypothetical protein
MRLTRNQVWGQTQRGFESPPLRSNWYGVGGDADEKFTQTHYTIVPEAFKIWLRHCYRCVNGRLIAKFCCSELGTSNLFFIQFLSENPGFAGILTQKLDFI